MPPFKIPNLPLTPSLTPSQLTHHLSQPSPQALHLTDLLTTWPALKTWTLSDHLSSLRSSIGEDRIIEVELGKRGRGYLDPEYQRISIPFGTFLDAFIFNLLPSTTPLSSLPTAYLAQSGLLDDVPSLSNAVPPLEHFRSGPRKEIWRRTLWIGPSGSFTPFHRDPYIGLYSQVVGKKRFHLLPPDASHLLELSSTPSQKNTSTIPIPVSRLNQQDTDQGKGEGVDRGRGESGNEGDISDIHAATLARYRKSLESAFGLPGACEVVVEAGESVLVPEGWWHSAEGVDGPGVGVGAWFR